MLEISLESLEGGCVVISVTDSLIRNYLDSYEMVPLARSVTLYCICGEYISVRDKYGQSTEIVKMMINGVDESCFKDFDELVRHKNKILHTCDEHTLIVVDKIVGFLTVTSILDMLFLKNISSSQAKL